MPVNKEALLSWRRICYLLIALLLVIFLFNALPSNTFDAIISQQLPHPSPKHLQYHFGDPSADNEAIDGLTDAQCSDAFPALFTEIERAVTYWKQEKKHSITSDDIATPSHVAALRVLIHENEMRVLSSQYAVDKMKASPDRALGVVYLLQRALESALAAGERLPTIEMSLNLRDDAEPGTEGSDTHSYWAFARTIANEAHQRLWLMPNFDFWFYRPTGSFADAKRHAMQLDAPFASKIPKVVWRGNAGFNPGVRGTLLEATKGKDWADVKEVHFDEDPPVAMDVDQFCRYAMTVYTEGVTYSGRLKFLMNCQSLLIVHDTQYATHYSHLLVGEGPDQNYVSVKRDWSDLETKVKYYLEHPEEADRIIANSIATFRSRYTTRAATSCYLRRLITSYASVSFTPEVFRTTSKGIRRRGVSFEEFMDNPQDKDYDED